MSVCGIHTVQEVQRINFDQVFMGVTSYCETTGFCCGVDEEAVLKKTVLRQAEQRILLMDSSKVGVKSTYSFCGFGDVEPPEILMPSSGVSEDSYSVLTLNK